MHLHDSLLDFFFCYKAAFYGITWLEAFCILSLLRPDFCAFVMFIDIQIYTLRLALLVFVLLYIKLHAQVTMGTRALHGLGGGDLLALWDLVRHVWNGMRFV